MKRDVNDKLRAGDLGDPFDGKEEYQKPTSDQPTEDINDAPLLSALYGIDQLRADRKRELVSLASLPGWPGCKSEAGHGWGAHLDRTLGGGICPGYLLGVGASSAGSGKTAWLMQLVDGLALRTAKLIRDNQPGPLTPIIIASEMSPAALSWRSIARWTSRDARIFRAGQSAERLLQNITTYPAREAKEAWEDAEKALSGELGDARSWMRFYQGNSEGPQMIKRLDEVLSQWVAAIQKKYPTRAILPVVVIDPIQRYQAKGDEVSALNELVECLGAAAVNRGWVGLLTSDTNKPSASSADKPKNKREEGAAAFRGSYKLQHLLDAALYLTRPEDSDPNQPELDLVIIKNRWGSATTPWPRYRWEPRFARFEALSEKEVTECDKIEKATKAAKASAKKSAKNETPNKPPGEDFS